MGARVMRVRGLLKDGHVMTPEEAALDLDYKCAGWQDCLSVGWQWDGGAVRGQLRWTVVVPPVVDAGETHPASGWARIRSSTPSSLFTTATCLTWYRRSEDDSGGKSGGRGVVVHPTCARALTLLLWLHHPPHPSFFRVARCRHIGATAWSATLRSPTPEFASPFGRWPTCEAHTGGCMVTDPFVALPTALPSFALVPPFPPKKKN